MSASTVPEQATSRFRFAAQTRLLQLASQALPTGAFAYSLGLESMLSLGQLENEHDCREYLCSLMETSVVCLELPRFLLMFDAISQGEGEEAVRQSRLLMAARETREFQEQDEQMARALCRVLRELRSEYYERVAPPSTYAEAMAWACHWFGVARDDACVLLVYTWVEQQVSALCRLLPLGPLAGQRLLDAVLLRVPEVIELAKRIEQSDIGASTPGLAIASALHETQYCRIFRS